MITLLLAFIESKYNGYFYYLYTGTVAIDLYFIKGIFKIDL
ncbi:hypothetical protein [Fusobacterium gastrosuis]|nr:hypothetical protein [Fusobacteriaceae bacterium]MDY3359130.1 hypothetical protein [Clostridium celatum]MDY5713839.1 hypothetical protein [Fusobacterium gastrosuis]